MNTNELINKYADTCLRITTAVYDGTVKDEDCVDVKQQAEDILISFLTEIAGVGYKCPVKRVTLNYEKENEFYLSQFRTAEEGENLDAYIFPLIGKTELTDMYVFTVDTVIKLEDKNGVKNLLALFYSRAKREVLFKIFTPEGEEGFLNFDHLTFAELPVEKLKELFNTCTPISVQGGFIDKNGINSFLGKEAKRAYLSRILKK